MTRIELDDFYNDGFGWICKHCERELKEQENNRGGGSGNANQASRLMREGEAESKNPRLSNPAPAKWADKAQRTLMCPRCGITELADKF
ncbi:MAG TPA: hypothetical protein VK400_11770 [Pyrinomonadaceae bacterium]|nr:hypothetical protein [Pyrinomonadaceae bacterium]